MNDDVVRGGVGGAGSLVSAPDSLQRDQQGCAPATALTHPYRSKRRLSEGGMNVEPMFGVLQPESACSRLRQRL